MSFYNLGELALKLLILYQLKWNNKKLDSTFTCVCVYTFF